MTTNESEKKTKTKETDSDWENRKLCIDESCIGTIGKDSRCRVCGLMDSDGTVNDSSSQDSVALEEDTVEPSSEDSLTFADDTEETVPEEDDTVDEVSGWETRMLCKDESCIGTIGANGRCNVCGLPEKKP